MEATPHPHRCHHGHLLSPHILGVTGHHALGWLSPRAPFLLHSRCKGGCHSSEPSPTFSILQIGFTGLDGTWIHLLFVG